MGDRVRLESRTWLARGEEVIPLGKENQGLATFVQVIAVAFLVLLVVGYIVGKA